MKTRLPVLFCLLIPLTISAQEEFFEDPFPLDPIGGTEINDLEATDPPNVQNLEVYIGTGAGTGTWQTQPAIDCTNCTSTPAGTQIVQLNSDMTVADAGAGTITVTVDGSAQAVWDVGGLTIGAADTTDQLNLPLSNDASTPTLAFGDGNSGFYEGLDNVVRVSTNGSGRWEFQATSFQGLGAGSARMENATSSSTNPTLNPSRNDVDTGIGLAADDQLSLIAGGKEGLRVEEGANGAVLANETIILLPTDVTGDPNSPGTDQLYVYVKNDSLFIKNDLGTVSDLANDEVGTKTTGDLCINDGSVVNCTVNLESELETALDGINVLVETEIDASSELAAIMDDETGTGLLVFATDPVFTTPDLGTPSALVLTNATGTLAGTVDLTAGMVDSGDFAAGAIDNADISGTINFLTSGTIRGAVDVVATTGTSLAVSADQAKGSMHTADSTSVVTFTLPAATTGLSACFYDLDATAIITVDVQTGDIITLDGTALSAGDSIDSAGAKGDFICLLGLDTTNWLTLGRSGTWIDGDV